MQKLVRSNARASAVEAIGKRHFSYCMQGSRRVLLVTFENIQRTRRDVPDGGPRGLGLVQPWGWSLMSLLSTDDTWFRDRDVYDYFDDLASAGYFEAFDRVVFYGAGPSAPGSVVLAISPQATLDPRRAGWDDRFPEVRRTRFDNRYGYAPDMLQACERAFILYDPESRLDAVHASLFDDDHVATIALRGLGPHLENELMAMGILPRILGVAAAGTLSRAVISKLYRKRRNNGHWLNGLAHRLTHRNRPWLTAVACRSILRRYPSTKLERLYDQSTSILKHQGRELPPLSKSSTAHPRG